MSYVDKSVTKWSRLELSSAQLIRVGQDNLPTGIASCCLAEYRGKRILLTVSHATGDQENWALQLRYEVTKGTQLYRLGSMNFLVKATLAAQQLKDVDFSYVKVPRSIVAYRQDVDEVTGKVKIEEPISIHKLTLTEIPDVDDSFGFCGMVLPKIERHPDTTFFTGEVRPYDGLKFLRTEGDYHVFKLPFAHPGHEHFRGCSGAPIINGAGSPVALVCHGDDANDEIWGISLAAYKVAIDIMTLDFANESA